MKITIPKTCNEAALTATITPPAELGKAADKMKKLDFIIAGVQKGGTTALWHFLKQHPNVQFGQRKELHFFDNEAFDWTNPPLSILRSEFEDSPETSKLGDATPIYTYWTPSLPRIRSYNPAIKIIVSFRNPVDRAYSHWRMAMARKAETLAFSEAIRDGRRRVIEKAEIDRCHRVFSYVERGFYVEQLDRLFALFPRDQILLLRDCDLRDHHGPTLDRVCDFLSIDRFPVYPERQEVFSHREAPFEPMSATDAAFLRDIYADDLNVLKNRYELDLYGSDGPVLGG